MCDGDEDITLADLKVNCIEDAEEPETGWMPLQDNVVLLDEDGNNKFTLVYMNEFWAEAYTSDTEQEWTKGWYDVDEVNNGEYTEKFDTEPVTFGFAFQVNVNSGNEEAGFTFSGAVKSGAPTITDVEKFMSVANCTPVNKTLADLKVNCIEDAEEPETGWMPLQDNVVLLDEDGNNKFTLVYMNEFWAEAYTSDTEQEWTKGWYDVDEVNNGEYTEKFDTEPILAGEGVQVNVNSGNEDVTVQIDSAL